MKEIIIGNEKFIVHYNSHKYVCCVDYKFSSASDKWIHKCSVKKLKNRFLPILKDKFIWKTTSLINIIPVDGEVISNEGSFYYSMRFIIEEVKKIIDQMEREVSDINISENKIINNADSEIKIKDKEKFKIYYNGFKYTCKLEYAKRVIIGSGASIDVHVNKYRVFNFLGLRIEFLIWNGICNDTIPLNQMDDLFETKNVLCDLKTAKKCAIKCIEFMEIRHSNPKVINS